jgi:hypothetical protein
VGSVEHFRPPSAPPSAPLGQRHRPTRSRTGRGDGSRARLAAAEAEGLDLDGDGDRYSRFEEPWSSTLSAAAPLTVVIGSLGFYFSDTLLYIALIAPGSRLVVTVDLIEEVPS